MSLFLTIYILVYGGMHAYCFWRLRAAGVRSWWAQGLLGLFLAAMVFAPIAARLLDGAGRFHLARAVALVGYIWMAVVFWFLMFGVAVDVWNLGLRLVALSRPSAARYIASPRVQVGIAGALILVFSLWGLVEAQRLRVRRVEVVCPALGVDVEPIRIAQISDLHLGLIVREGYLSKVVELLGTLDADVLVSTGDLVDASFDHLDREVEMLAALDFALGKYAVTGNHEYYPGLEDTLAFHRAAGFTMLRAEAVEIGEHLLLAGVDDPAGRHTGGESRMDEDAILPEVGAPRRRAVVLLKHRPAVREASRGRFDVQISGHIHGGQIWPFNWFVRLEYAHPTGRTSLGEGGVLEVSRGTGTWGPPMRVFAPPEITLLTLVGAAGP